MTLPKPYPPTEIAYTDWNTLVDAVQPLVSYPESEASYIIFTDGTNYYAKNGATGVVTSSGGTDGTGFLNSLIVTLNFAGGGTIYLKGSISGTTLLTALSNVDVYGGIITVTTNSDGAALTVGSITNATWKNVEIHRAGTPAFGWALDVTGGDETVRFIECDFINDMSIIDAYGVYERSTAAATFINCNAYGGPGIVGHSASYGWRFDDTSAGKLYDCTATGGGSGGTYNHGFMIIEDAAPILYNCIGQGGGTGTSSNDYGFFLGDRSTAQLYECLGIGGPSSPGVSVHDSFAGRLEGCTGKGGSGNVAHGWIFRHVSTPILTNCISIAGGGTDSVGYYIIGGSAPTLINCVSDVVRHSDTWYYDDADNGRFMPVASTPYMLLNMDVAVFVATPGVTLNIGTSIGGSEIASGISLATTGLKHFSITRSQIAANGYIYATTSGPAADNSFFIGSTVCNNYVRNYGIRIGTTGYAYITGGSYTVNGANDVMFIEATSVTNQNWLISNAQLTCLDPVNKNAIQANSAMADPPVYGCILTGKMSNITPDGSNVFTTLTYINSGTATILNTTTSIVVAHGCDYTPTAADITVTPTENPTNTPGLLWVDTIGAANFTINCENDPGASNLDVSWAVRKTP